MEEIGERGRKQSTNEEKWVKTRGKKAKKRGNMRQNQPVTVVAAGTARIGQNGAHTMSTEKWVKNHGKVR